MSSWVIFLLITNHNNTMAVKCHIRYWPEDRQETRRNTQSNWFLSTKSCRKTALDSLAAVNPDQFLAPRHLAVSLQQAFDFSFLCLFLFQLLPPPSLWPWAVLVFFTMQLFQKPTSDPSIIMHVIKTLVQLLLVIWQGSWSRTATCRSARKSSGVWLN